MGMKLDHFRDQASIFLHQNSNAIGFQTVVLDNWRGVRLIYEIGITNCCESQCNRCSLFKLVGEDRPHVEPEELKFTLYEANRKDLDLFPSKQRYLNCKGFHQYIEAFITWLVNAADTYEKMDGELEKVANFIILMKDRNIDTNYLHNQEKKYKKMVVEESLQRMDLHDPRRQWISQLATKWKIL